MFEYIKGTLADLTPAMAIIECNGPGYALNISLNTYTALQGQKECKLYVYEAIREDAFTLYGFADKYEREFFLQLIAVSGVGGNTARMILSAFSPPELYHLITGGNVNLLKTVKGIGLKTAQRIIIELKDKVKPDDGGGSAITGKQSASPHSVVRDEALAALAMLGFAVASSQQVVSAILKEEPDAPVEKVIKLSLKRL